MSTEAETTLKDVSNQENPITNAVSEDAESEEKPVAVKEEITKEEEMETEEVAEKVETKTEEVAEKVETKTEEVVEKEETKTEEIVEKEETKTDEVAEKVETKTEEVVEKVETKTEEVVEKVETKTEEVAEKVETKTEEVAEKVETELDKYWRAVKDNPSDFTGWTYLLQYVEQENNLASAREAYDAFFACYPYCYGYWKKYADMEKRHNNLSKSIEVFERGVKAIPLSVELWLHYLNFYIAEFNCDDKIREVYERAIAEAGTDFRSDKLWENYIAWEKDLKNVTAIYDKLLATPIQLYSHHFGKFKTHIQKHHPKEVLPLDEFLKLRQQIVKTLAVTETAGAEGEDLPPGEEVPPGMEEEVDKIDQEEVTKLREKIIETREKIFKETEEEITKRWVFEEGIKRPYFHVKPLERSQLKNWREYLNFEIQTGSHKRVVVLFERCMIATCLYEEFWLKYSKYMEEHGLDGVKRIYQRACTIHLPKKPYLHLAWAAYAERQGKADEALKILENLDKVLPSMVMVAMRRISLERRHGNQDKVEQLYQDYLHSAPQKAVCTFFSMKYARYLYKVIGDEAKAKKIIDEALVKDPTEWKLYVQLLDMEYQKRPVDMDSTLKVFSHILKCEHLDSQTKLNMSQRRIEFLEDFGSSILELKECYEEHQKLVKDTHSSEKEKKRKNVNQTEDVTLDKKQKVNHNGSTGSHPAQPDYSAYWAQYQQSAGYAGYSAPSWGGNYSGQYGYT